MILGQSKQGQRGRSATGHRRSLYVSTALAGILCAYGGVQPAQAQSVVVIGDVRSGTAGTPVWAAEGDLFVGDVGAGSMTISGGGKVSNSRGATGAVTVSGAGSTWTNTGNLDVGPFGTGTLTIADRGTVTNTNGFIGFSLGSSGVATVSGAGSTWTNDGVLLSALTALVR